MNLRRVTVQSIGDILLGYTIVLSLMGKKAR